MSDKKIIFCQYGKENRWHSFGVHLFADLMQDDRVIYLDSKFPVSSHSWINFLRRVHFSQRINHKINLPFKWVWKCSLETIPWDDQCSYVVVFLDGANPIPIKKLQKIKQAHQVKYSLLLLNPFTLKRQAEQKPYFEKVGFDYVFTFDQADAKTYGFSFTDTFYSILPHKGDQMSNAEKKDIYYIGGNKGRLQNLLALYSVMKDNNISSIYRITDVDESEQRWENEIIYNDFIDYSTTIEELRPCNCILELIAADQFGATLRYYEAICYDKKLLTNNKNVVNLPFYNPDYIHVFEKPEDIDWGWVKERVPVDYHYDGQFSPIHLVDKILSIENAGGGVILNTHKTPKPAHFEKSDSCLAAA